MVWFDLLLIFAVTWPHLAFFWAGCPCCGECFNVCPGPPDVPEEFMITVSGVSNGTCSNCGVLNGTFVLSYLTASTGTNGCEWRSPTMTVCSLPNAYYSYLILCGGLDHPPVIDEFHRNGLAVAFVDNFNLGQPQRPFGVPFSGYGPVTVLNSGLHSANCTNWPASIHVEPV